MSERTASTATFWAVDDDRTADHCSRALADAIDGGVVQLAPDGRVLAVDETILELTGASRDDLVGDGLSTFLSISGVTDEEDEEADRERAVRTRLRDDAGAPLEASLRTADGGSLPCTLRLRSVRADGCDRGAVGVLEVDEQDERDERAERGGAERTVSNAQPGAEPELEPGAGTEPQPTTFDAPTAVLEDADVGVFVLDSEFDVAWINEATERYFGLERDAVVGRDNRRVIAETIGERVADPEGFTETVTATYDDNTAVERFECHVTPGEDRAERWLEHRSKPIESGPYAGGRLELYYDVTEQHRRAYQLRRLNEAVREWLAASSPEAVAERATTHIVDILDLEVNGVFLYDRDADHLQPVSWSDAADDLFDSLPTFGPGEGIAWRVFDSGRGETYSNVTDDPDVYNPETPIRSEICLPIGDHGIVIIGSQRRDAFDEGDLSLAKVVASSLETAFDRLRHERHLERERAQTEQLLQTAPVAISVTDADGETVRSNRRARETPGVADDRSIGAAATSDGWVARDPTADFEPIEPDRTPTARVRASGEAVFDRELVLEGPGGERTWLSVNATPVFDDDGDLERVISVGEDITELKRQERRLERRKSELETELSEILGRVSDGFYALDEEFRFTHVNETAERLLGRSREELLGAVVWDVFPDAVGSDLDERFREAYETQEPVSFERDSEPLGIWAQVQVYPSETGLSVYFRDITERKARERELATYETIVETIEDGIYELDDDGRFTTVNAAYEALTGYDREELLGSHASLVVDESVMVLAADVATDDHEEPTVETELETKAGDRVPVEATVTSVDTDRNRVGVVRDVTERRDRERRLAESERRYRTLAENFPDGLVALYDDEMRYTAAGGQLVGEFGIDRSDIVGATIYDRYSADLLAEIEPHFRAALEGDERSFEMTYHGRDLLAHTLPVRTDGDDRTGMLVVQDVTERKEYERKLEESNERLEQFAYAASHDLQEPLRMVTSYLQLLESRYADELDADAEEFIDFAVDGADRMRKMIDGLLEYSRVETRGDPFEPVALDDVLADVRRDLELQITESGAEIETPEPLPEVHGDPSQLRQVFQNLVSNAIEYSGDGPPRVTVSAERRDEGSTWTVSVRDEGIGIDPEDADRVFDIFQRLHSREEHDGTGIGLALCERILERHGGEIWVESEPGEGATFSMTLPAADA